MSGKVSGYPDGNQNYPKDQVHFLLPGCPIVLQPQTAQKESVSGLDRNAAFEMSQIILLESWS